MAKARNTGGERLRGILERIERLQEEIKALQSDIKDIKLEAKSAGFDVKVISQMLRERKMSDADRAEWQALCETYRAALGMLDGTPLGYAARRRFAGDPDDASTDPKSEPEKTLQASPPNGVSADAGDDAEDEPASALSQPTADDVAAARAQGSEAARSGVKVTANPYVFADARRAAWDEGWCSEAGSDGMELPSAWRRSKPAKADGKGAGG